jgi:hypothetical protein
VVGVDEKQACARAEKNILVQTRKNFQLFLPLTEKIRVSGRYQQRHQVADQEKLGEKWWRILPAKYRFHIAHGSFNMP